MKHKQHRQQHLEPHQQDALRILDRPGEALSADTRAFLEPRFNHSFGDVRVHSDSRAVQSAEAMESRAFAVGQDIVMNSGEYNPNTQAGLGLLAHELTHTIQQPRRSRTPRLSETGDTSETEANRAARNAITGAGSAQISANGSEAAGINRMISGAFDDWSLPSWGDVTGAVGGAISGGAGAIGGGISNAYGLAGNAIGGIGSAMGGGISDIGSFAGGAARGIGSLFGEGSVGAGVGNIAGNAISGISGLIGGGVSGTAAGIGSRVARGGGNIGAGIGNLGAEVGGFLGGLDAPSMPYINPEWLLM